MTKAKKKMNKSTFVIIIMAVAMVALLAFGGTFAYFTATTSTKTSTATTGTVQLAENTVATLVTDKVVSGSALFNNSKVQVTSKSNVDTYVFVTFSATMEGGNLVASKDAISADGDYFLDITQASGWTSLGSNVYGRKVTSSETSAIDVCTAITFYGKSNSTETTAGTIMAKTITVSISSEAIQALSENGSEFSSITDAYAALHPST